MLIFYKNFKILWVLLVLFHKSHVLNLYLNKLQFITTLNEGEKRQENHFQEIRKTSAKLTLDIRLFGSALNPTATTSSLTRWIGVVVVATVNL